MIFTILDALGQWVRASSSCVTFLFSFPTGSPYYDNVRPLCYSDSDAVLLCFDVSRPETMDSALKKVRSVHLSMTR